MTLVMLGSSSAAKRLKLMSRGSRYKISDKIRLYVRSADTLSTATRLLFHFLSEQAADHP